MSGGQASGQCLAWNRPGLILGALRGRTFRQGPQSLSENSKGSCFRGKDDLARREERAYPQLVCERGATPPERILRENPPGGGSFACGLCWLGPYSPRWGCAGLAAWATAKIPCRRTPFQFSDRLLCVACRLMGLGESFRAHGAGEACLRRFEMLDVPAREEITDDLFGGTNADLNVIQFAEAGGRIQGTSLQEKAASRVE